MRLGLRERWRKFVKAGRVRRAWRMRGSEGGMVEAGGRGSTEVEVCC